MNIDDKDKTINVTVLAEVNVVFQSTAIKYCIRSQGILKISSFICWIGLSKV